MHCDMLAVCGRLKGKSVVFECLIKINQFSRKMELFRYGWEFIHIASMSIECIGTVICVCMFACFSDGNLRECYCSEVIIQIFFSWMDDRNSGQCRISFHNLKPQISYISLKRNWTLIWTLIVFYRNIPK